MVAGDPGRKLEVLREVSLREKEAIQQHVSSCPIRVVPGDNGKIFYIHVELHSGEDRVSVTVETFHANITQIEKNGTLLYIRQTAAKIAMAVEAGIMGYEMYIHGQNQFADGEGIVKKGVDNTVSTVGRIARYGMRSMDREILAVMTDLSC